MRSETNTLSLLCNVKRKSYVGTRKCCDLRAHNKFGRPSEFLIPSQSIHGINIIYEAATGIDQSDSTTVGNSHYHSHYQETHSLVQRVCYNLYRG